MKRPEPSIQPEHFTLLKEKLANAGLPAAEPAPPGNRRKRSPLERLLESQLSRLGIAFVPELEFAKPFRKWRFDFAFPEYHVAVEVHGGTWSGGRHTRGAGFEADCQKHNGAIMHGWLPLKFTARMVKDGTAISTIVHVLIAAAGY
ncbi:MAG: hypothetical protein L0170_07285 [Acidobacteria bacterium]|nr:hypothetical protein [Acidobacteriota bacterium]